MKEKIQYKLLEKELDSYKSALSKAADTIVEQNVSNYPIFIVHQHSVDIGIQMVDKEKVVGNWSVNASSLEEFVTKQIVKEDKLKEFKSVFKSHPNELCLFVLSELGAEFVFLPRI